MVPRSGCDVLFFGEGTSVIFRPMMLYVSPFSFLLPTSNHIIVDSNPPIYIYSF